MTGKPRFKDTGGGSFCGAYLYDRSVPEGHFLRILRGLFDWERLGAHLLGMYQGRGLVGRPPYDPVMMFKMLFLGYLYNLSERDTERFVNESIPAHYFLDLAFDLRAPDHSSLALYRKRLVRNGNWDDLQVMFDGLLQQARDKGLRLGRIQLVDSVHTQADVNNQKERERLERGEEPRDPDARVVCKGERDIVEADGRRVKRMILINGYKSHTSADAKAGITTSLIPALGDTADNKAFPSLLAHDRSLGLPTHTYGGDKAYDDTDLFERIEAQGLHVGIKLRRTRLSKKDANKERWLELQKTPYYRAATKLRSRVEHTYAQAKDQHGLDRCRYRGLLNYGIQSFLTFMVVNAKRMVKLLTGNTFREQAKGRRKEVYKPVYAA